MLLSQERFIMAWLVWSFVHFYLCLIPTSSTKWTDEAFTKLNMLFSVKNNKIRTLEICLNLTTTAVALWLQWNLWTILLTRILHSSTTRPQTAPKSKCYFLLHIFSCLDDPMPVSDFEIILKKIGNKNCDTVQQFCLTPSLFHQAITSFGSSVTMGNMQDTEIPFIRFSGSSRTRLRISTYYLCQLFFYAHVTRTAFAPFTALRSF